MAEYYQMSVEQTLDQLGTKAEQGLTTSQVQERQAKYGLNTLPKEEGTSILQLIISQFTDVMVIILIIAAIISLFLGEVTDVVVIMIIVILNAALGVYQEYRAEQALAALSAMQVPIVTVRRNGEIHQVNAEELVPGDIVLLEEGASIPADGRLIESINLQVAEAALTGESVAVGKNTRPLESADVPLGDRKNMVYMGTAVSFGRGAFIVANTGLKTELGNIASMLLQVEEGITPLQRRLNSLGQALATGALIVVVIVFLVGWLARGIPAQEMFLIAVSLAVAAVPEGLPALVTISLSLGAAKMVNRHALIRRLPAVETLGSVTTICSDKTGTLTKNEMTATHLALPGHEDVKVTGIGYTPEGEFLIENGGQFNPHEDADVGRFLKAMALSTNAHIEMLDGGKRYNVVGDTTEGALVVAAQKVGWTRQQLEADMPRQAEFPFSSERKAMTTVHEVVGENAKRLFPESSLISITKGAPDRLIEWAKYERLPDGSRELTPKRRERWQGEVNDMAADGLRVLGVAYRPLDGMPPEVNEDLERDLHLIGLVGIVDPARPEAREAVALAKQAGIRSMMITGDHALSAEAIAENLGIIEPGQHAITGAELDKMSDAQLKEALTKTSAFARVSPQHKLRIVRALQEGGQVVAMTGDGVNDAPALKQADIGVAMGITGTDVSKGASEMVLTDDNFASIVAAVEEGRAIYDNIKKFIKYLLSSNVGEILVMFVALLVGLRIPLLAIQILWINLVTDGLPAIAIGFGKPEEGVMNRPPRPVDESIFADGVGKHIIRIGILIAILTLGGFVYGFAAHGMNPLERTLGMEEFDRAKVVEIVEASAADVDVPTTWDTWTLAMREAYLLEESLLTEETEALVGMERIAVTELLRDEVDIPEDWDTLTEEAKLAVLTQLGEAQAEGEFDEVEALQEEESVGIIGAAERVPRTIAFTILAFTQMFEVMGIHVGNRATFFRKRFNGNSLLMWAVVSTFVLQILVVYVPFLQDIFRTGPLTLVDFIITGLLGSVILFAVELEKWAYRREHKLEA